MEVSRLEHWSSLPFPTPGHLHDPEILHLFHWQANSLKQCHLEGAAQCLVDYYIYKSVLFNVKIDVFLCASTFVNLSIDI